MERGHRIIMDWFRKGAVPCNDGKCKENDLFANVVNSVYGFLYSEGILKEVSFRYVEYPTAVYFAFDVYDLLPYRKKLCDASIANGDTAISAIFDGKLKTCRYSGTLQPSSTMETYRDNCGCIGKSIENEMVQDLNNEAVGLVHKIRHEKGIRIAAEMVFDLTAWNPKENVDDLASELATFIYDYDVFEYRDAFDDFESAVSQMKFDLSTSENAKNVIMDLEKFRETIDGEEYEAKLNAIISKIKSAFPSLCH